MKIFTLSLSVILAVILGCAVEVDAESPVVMDSGGVMTATLLTAEFEVNISEFDSTGEIILDVKFHNPTNMFHGINPDQINFYEKYPDQRNFYITIDDLTNSVKYQIESEDMQITTDDDFIKLHGEIKKYKDRFVVEVLDIDKLAPFDSGVNALIETQLKISSSKFFPDHEYEIDVYTHTLVSESLRFTLPEDKPDDGETVCTTNYEPVCGINKVTYSNLCYLGSVTLDYKGECKSEKEISQSKQEQTMSDIEQQMKLQQQKALEEAEKRKQESKIKVDNDVPTSCSSIGSPVCGVNGETYMNQCFIDANRISLDHEGECIKKTITEKTHTQTIYEIIPEPTMKPEPVEKKKCGLGTELVDDYCKIITNDEEYIATQPVNEEKGFFEWLMSLFGM